MYKALTVTYRKRVVFKVGDLVWTVLTYNKFPVDEYNKLKERKIDLCEVL